MTDPTPARVFTATLVDALYRLGLRHVCISPGLRNAPLVLAFAKSEIATWIHHDERSAGFFAIGLARRSGAPTAVVCTSGSAATHYYPAIVEAKASQVPLLVLTADRPPELRGIGAPQTIDQIQLYGTATKWFHDAEVPNAASVTTAPNLAVRMWTIANEVPAGPIHVNFPFREPLTSTADSEVRATATIPPQTPCAPIEPPESTLNKLSAELEGKRLLIVSGALNDPRFLPAVTNLARLAEAPIHADPLSGLRHGGHDKSCIIVSSDLLSGAGWLDSVRPNAVLRFGALPTSKPLWQWLEKNRDIYQVIVSPAEQQDPISAANTIVRGDPSITAQNLARLIAPTAAGWLERWQQVDVEIQELLDQQLGSHGLSEPLVARVLTKAARGVVGIASSMPIRDIDAFGTLSDQPVQYVGNRGTNGIDGLLSMTLGAVAASGQPGHALIGDVAALHDLTALVTASRLDIPLTSILIHNDGGGIFHFLPLATNTDPDDFEHLFGTPHGTDFIRIAEAMGVTARQVDDMTSLTRALDEESQGPRLIVIHTDRLKNFALHKELTAAVETSLR